MKNRTDEIRRRHQERKKVRKQPGSREQDKTFYFPEPGEREDDFSYYGHDQKGNQSHPLFKKERVLFKIMAAICLFLVIGVLFKHPNPNLDEARTYVNNMFQKGFQFATVAGWYEEQFGEPVALFPSTDKDQNEVSTEQPQYVQPVSGTVTESFADNKQGIMLQTVSDTAVKSVKQGLVIDIKNSESLGKTVVIQHPDDSESVYGMLETVSVDMYDYIETGTKVGTVTPADNGKSGTFYFALKQEGQFINPLKVFSFD